MWLARVRSSARLAALRPLPRALPLASPALPPLLSHSMIRSMSTDGPVGEQVPSPLPSGEEGGLASMIAAPRRGPRPEDRPRGDTSRKYIKIDDEGWAYARGSRKRAVARVWVREVKEGETAQILVNGKSLSEWLTGHWAYRLNVMEPFMETNTVGKYTVNAKAHGGGLSGTPPHPWPPRFRRLARTLRARNGLLLPPPFSRGLVSLARTHRRAHTRCLLSSAGQAQAVRHGIATALQGLDMDLRPPLKTAGFLTRDHREVERLKPGQTGARKKWTWVKR